MACLDVFWLPFIGRTELARRGLREGLTTAHCVLRPPDAVRRRRYQRQAWLSGCDTQNQLLSA